MTLGAWVGLLLAAVLVLAGLGWLVVHSVRSNERSIDLRRASGGTGEDEGRGKSGGASPLRGDQP